MFKLLWKWMVSFFTADKIGILVRILLIKYSKSAVSELLNVETQKKAYEFVKQLHSITDISSYEKAQIFNLKMLDWAKSVGKNLSISIINCLRELAVTAIKEETSEK